MARRFRPFMKLDVDWFRDPKFLKLEDENGRKYTGDALKIYTILHENLGSMKKNDETMLVLRSSLDCSEKYLEKLLDAMSAASLIDPSWYEEGLIGSERSVREADEAERRKASCSASANKRWHS